MSLNIFEPFAKLIMILALKYYTQQDRKSFSRTSKLREISSTGITHLAKRAHKSEKKKKKEKKFCATLRSPKYLAQVKQEGLPGASLLPFKIALCFYVRTNFPCATQLVTTSPPHHHQHLLVVSFHTTSLRSLIYFSFLLPKILVKVSLQFGWIVIPTENHYPLNEYYQTPTFQWIIQWKLQLLIL